MEQEKTIIPVLNRMPSESKSKENHSSGCGHCSGGTCGAFGIRAGSEKTIVYRNLLLFAIMGIGMLIAAYIISVILSLFVGN